MNKKELREILFRIRDESKGNDEVLKIINNILGRVDMKAEDEIERITRDFDETKIREYIANKIEKARTRDENSFFNKVNEFFEYGITSATVHLHLPGDFHKMFEKNGKIKGSAIITRKLIDAAYEINNRRNMGDEKLKKCDSFYMISPIFYAPTFYPKILRNNNIRDRMQIETPIFKLFKLMGLDTRTYMRENLQDSEFVKNNEEAKLAVKTFGTKRDVGAVALTFDKFNSKKFQRNLKRVTKILDRALESEKEER